jgi:Subtilase family
VAEVVVVVDPNEPEASSHILGLDPSAQALTNVGLVSCELSERQLADLVSITGILGVTARSGAWPVVEALERLLEIHGAAASAQIGAANDSSIVGGLTDGDPYPERLDEPANESSSSFPTRPAQMVVINMSLGPHNPEAPFDRLDPVNVATTRAAERVVVTAAAGNSSQRADGRETMSAWAEAPWVVAVGATTAEDGDTLARYSSVGYAGLPDTGPDIVAWGSSTVDQRVRGTSFAAPHAALQVLVFAAAFETLRHCYERLAGQSVFGIPLMGVGLVDSDFRYERKDRIDARALPVIAVNEQAFEDGLTEIDRVGITLDPTVTPARLRFVLEASARALPPHGRHEVGYGFVGDDQTIAALEAMTAAHLADVFGDRTLTAEIREELGRYVLFDSAELPTLFEWTRRTAPAWQADFVSAEVSRLIVEEPYPHA